jgi:hypothetical protein
VALTPPLSDESASTGGKGGDTLQTGGAPDPNDPVETTVTTPNPGPITISEGPTTQTPQSGYSFLGQQVTITAPAASVTSPLTLMFRVDNSLLPFGVNASNLAIAKDGGSPIGPCDASGHAAPTDPCVSARETFSGYIQITVLSSEASDWNFAVQKRSRIVVVQRSSPEDAQDFPYAAGGGLTPASFSLDDDSDSTLDDKRVFDQVSPGSGYSIAQSVIAGWYTAGASCDNGDSPASITVAPEETVTCTFVNSRGYPRPRGATPLRASLVPAYKPCTIPNTAHGGPAPLDQPACKPPVEESGQLTVGTPDANGRGVNFTGFVQFNARQGNSTTPADEADVLVSARLSDVRNRSDLSDYTGELAGVVDLQIVDKLNGATGGEAGAMATLPFSFSIPCSATSSASVGATCATQTTADALVPGLVSEGKRSIWQLDQVRVFDGGSDGLASTGTGNTLFATQGVFVP